MNNVNSLAGALTGGGTASAEKIISEYITGTKYIASSQLTLMKAANIKTERDVATAEIRNLTAGATAQQIEEANKIVTENSKLMQEAIANKRLKLDEKGKKAFAEGIDEFAKGALSYTTVAMDAQGYKPSIASFGSAVAAVVIAKNIPSDLISVKNTFSALYGYAKSNNITLSKDTSEATKSLGDF